MRTGSSYGFMGILGDAGCLGCSEDSGLGFSGDLDAFLDAVWIFSSLARRGWGRAGA